MQLFVSEEILVEPFRLFLGQKQSNCPFLRWTEVATISSSVRARAAKGSIDSRKAAMQSGSVLPIVPSRSKRTAFRRGSNEESTLLTISQSSRQKPLKTQA